MWRRMRGIGQGTGNIGLDQERAGEDWEWAQIHSPQGSYFQSDSIFPRKSFFKIGGGRILQRPLGK